MTEDCVLEKIRRIDYQLTHRHTPSMHLPYLRAANQTFELHLEATKVAGVTLHTGKAKVAPPLTLLDLQRFCLAHGTLVFSA